MQYKIIVIIAVFLSACSQMLLKRAAKQNYDTFLSQYLNLNVIFGYGIMFVAMGINIYAMSNGVNVKEVSIIESISYLFVPMLSWICFNEKLSKRQILSVMVIMAGVVVFFM